MNVTVSRVEAFSSRGVTEKFEKKKFNFQIPKKFKLQTRNYGW